MYSDATHVHTSFVSRNKPVHTGVVVNVTFFKYNKKKEREMKKRKRQKKARENERQTIVSQTRPDPVKATPSFTVTELGASLKEYV